MASPFSPCPAPGRCCNNNYIYEIESQTCMHPFRGWKTRKPSITKKIPKLEQPDLAIARFRTGPVFSSMVNLPAPRRSSVSPRAIVEEGGRRAALGSIASSVSRRRGRRPAEPKNPAYESPKAGKAVRASRAPQPLAPRLIRTLPTQCVKTRGVRASTAAARGVKNMSSPQLHPPKSPPLAAAGGVPMPLAGVIAVVGTNEPSSTSPPSCVAQEAIASPAGEVASTYFNSEVIVTQSTSDTSEEEGFLTVLGV